MCCWISQSDQYTFPHCEQVKYYWLVKLQVFFVIASDSEAILRKGIVALGQAARFLPLMGMTCGQIKREGAEC